MKFLDEDILAEIITPAGDFEATADNMPRVSAEITGIKWSEPDPSIGIMGGGVDDYTLVAHFGTGTHMSSLQILASLIKGALGVNIVENEQELYAKLNELEQRAVVRAVDEGLFYD